MDAHANFAFSTVVTAPSPAASGTTIDVTAGHGARFPTPPFNATVWPLTALPQVDNAEIVRVTAIVGDTLTIDRAQEASSARTIIVGDAIAATITAQTLTDIEDVLITPAGTSTELQYRSGSALAAADLLYTKSGSIIDIKPATAAASATGATVRVYAAAGGATSGDGGSVWVVAGDAASGNGGNVVQNAGTSVGGGQGGSLQYAAGGSAAQDGAQFLVYGGDDTDTNLPGGMLFEAGSGVAGSGHDGGTLQLAVGAGDGAGADGVLQVKSRATGFVASVDPNQTTADRTYTLPDLGGTLAVLSSYTVAGLPAATAGRIAFASNGRKNGEGGGAGTGVLCYSDGTAWRRVSDDTTVVA